MGEKRYRQIVPHVDFYFLTAATSSKAATMLLIASSLLPLSVIGLSFMELMFLSQPGSEYLLS